MVPVLVLVVVVVVVVVMVMVMTRRLLTQVHLSHLLLRQRLLLRVLPAGATCACGEDASNLHTNVCKKQSWAIVRRHDLVVSALAQCLREHAFDVRVEPRAVDHDKTRADAIAVRDGRAIATDAVVAFPGVMESGLLWRRLLRVANRSAAGKNRQWQEWARERGFEFAPLALESVGGIAACTCDWLRRVLDDGGAGPSLAVRSDFDEVVARITSALHAGNALLFARTDGVATLG